MRLVHRLLEAHFVWLLSDPYYYLFGYIPRLSDKPCFVGVVFGIFIVILITLVHFLSRQQAVHK